MTPPASQFPLILATIDVGTNTALLLVARVVADGTLTSLHEAERFVRLGEGVDATGRVTEAAMERLRVALQTYRDEAEAHGAEDILIAATSASRDAQNRAALIDFVRRETGLEYEILPGEEEAALTFLGAISAFDLSEPCAVIDIGGGSTEIIVGDPDKLFFRRSLDIGSVRLAERCFPTQPPTPEAIGQAERVIQDALDAATVPLDASMPVIGAAGTLVALARVHDAAHWQQAAGRGVILSESTIHTWRTRLLGLTHAEILALNPSVMQGRADVFPAGVLILDIFMQRFGLTACRVSPRGVRHGLALRAARQAMSVDG